MSFFSRLTAKKSASVPFCTAIVPAAGSSTRMEGQDKMFALLAGEPVIVHTLRALQNSEFIQEIIVVTREDLILPISDLCKAYALYKVTKVIRGGATRTESVRLGTLEASQQAELLAIHDGARPLVSEGLISAVILRAADCHAAAPAVPVKDTVKRCEGGFVKETLPRETLCAIQTPQVFQASLIKAALEKALTDGAELTDDCSAVERLGMSVALTAGEDTNLKITTPADLAVAEGILEWRSTL
ncbi:MAG: 2-C-methyl-D-erythritol 4-phosphate cytidylyltransferase [Oscillospiraceae bacterium]